MKLNTATQNHQTSIIKDAFAKPDAIDFYLNDPKGLFPPEKKAFEQYHGTLGKCLNIGCGLGRETIPLAQSGLDVFAIDFVEQAVSIAKKESQKKGVKINFCVGDCRHLMFKNNSFDHVVMINTAIQFLSREERRSTLKEIKRILKEKGTLIIHADNRFITYDFPYTHSSLVMAIWRAKKMIFGSDKSWIRKTKAAKKMQEPKSDNFFLLLIDSLTTTASSFLIDGKRSLMQRILRRYYKGPAPYHRRVSSTVVAESLRYLPYYFYRAREAVDDAKDCGMPLVDYQSDWELVFCDRLPSFLRDRAPISYYFFQKNPETHQLSQKKFDEIVSLLKSGISEKGSIKFEIISNSMRPMLSMSNKLYAQNVSFEDLCIGDIIIFKSSSRLIAHRIIDIKNSSHIVTKGDNHKEVDPYIAQDDIIARVFSIDTGRFTVRIDRLPWKITNTLLAKISYWQISKYNWIIKNLFVSAARFSIFIVNPSFIRFYIQKYYGIERQKEIIVRLCNSRNIEKNKDILNSLIEDCRHWRQFLPIALYNNVGPIIYKNLQTMNLELIPPWVIHSLKENYKQSVVKTTTSYSDLSVLLKEFEQNNIHAIVIKGAAIAEKLYKDISLRPMEDIDFLVKKSDWPIIRRILAKEGFKNSEGLDLLELENNSSTIMNRHFCYRNQNGTKLEFKFNLFALDFPKSSDAEEYWRDAQEIKIADVSSLTLSNEDQFLFLAARMANVGFRYLLWFLDLKEFLFSHKDLDWQAIVKKATRKKVSLALYYSLRILKDKLLVEEIPDNVFDQIQPHQTKRRILDFLFGYNNIGFRGTGRRKGLWHFFAYHCLLLDKFGLRFSGLVEMFRYALNVAFPPINYICYRYKISKWKAYSGVGLLLRLRRARQK